jgi:hypothetical protein
MLSRRDFLRGASALAMTPHVERVLEHHLRHEAPAAYAAANGETRLLHASRP